MSNSKTYAVPADQVQSSNDSSRLDRELGAILGTNNKMKIILGMVVMIMVMSVTIVCTWKLVMIGTAFNTSFYDVTQPMDSTNATLTPVYVSVLILAVILAIVCMWLSYGLRIHGLWRIGLIIICSMFMAVTSGILIANEQLDNEVNEIKAGYNAVRDQREKEYMNAPQVCALEILNHRDDFTQSPCSACIGSDLGLWNARFSNYDIPDYDTSIVYQTKPLVPFEHILCEEDLKDWSPFIWKLCTEHTINTNNSAPEGEWPCETLTAETIPAGPSWKQDWTSPETTGPWHMHPAPICLDVYIKFWKLWSPLVIEEIKPVETSTQKDCMIFRGYGSLRYFLTTRCGLGLGSTVPNPAHRAPWDPDLSDCRSPALEAFDAQYEANLSKLNASIYSVPAVPSYAQDYPYTGIAFGGAIVILFLILVIVCTLCCPCSRASERGSERDYLIN